MSERPRREPITLDRMLAEHPLVTDASEHPQCRGCSYRVPAGTLAEQRRAHCAHLDHVAAWWRENYGVGRP